MAKIIKDTALKALFVNVSILFVTINGNMLGQTMEIHQLLEAINDEVHTDRICV